MNYAAAATTTPAGPFTTLLLLLIVVLLPSPPALAFVLRPHPHGRSSSMEPQRPLCSSPPIFYSGGSGNIRVAAVGDEGEDAQSTRLTWGASSVTEAASSSSSSSSSASPATRAAASASALASTTTAELMSLDSIRSTLIRQEDSIIFALIERAQFRRNEAIYAKGILQLDPTIPDYPFLKSLSFLEYLLLETEKLHGKVRRYTSPEEHAFFPEHLPDPILTPLQFPQLLAPNDVDVNAEILDLYIHQIVPAVCKPGDDEQHGSSVLADITLLQAISRRVHLGKFVAEAKFQESEAQYRDLVAHDDVDGVMELLTNKAVEARVLDRAKLKASTYGQDITGETEECKVEPEVIAAIYRDIIIPLTKDVEVLYLYLRVGRAPPQLPATQYRLQVER